MFTLTLAQMRRSLGRLTAAGIAIVIGTAFVAATLLAGEVLKRSSYDSIAASYADASLIVQATPEPGVPAYAAELETADLDTIRSVESVQAADPVLTMSAMLNVGSKSSYVPVIGVGSDPSLQPLELTGGSLPETPEEIALPVDVAERLGVSLGGTVTEAVATLTTGENGEEEWSTTNQSLVVVGLVDDPDGAFSMTGGAGLVSQDSVATRMEAGWGATFREATVMLAPGTAIETARSELQALGTPGFTVMTKDEAALASVAAVTNGQDVFTMTILAFAAVALLVAALVISNTFQVIVAQRTRTLALLRCVGASKRQLRSSVLLEASLLGLVSSAIGFATGALLVQATVLILQRFDLDVPIPQTITVTVGSVVWPLVVGTLVTVLASLVPARAATRVAPLAALRPAELEKVSTRTSRVRLVFSLLLVLGGGALMVAGLPLATEVSVELGLLAGMVGGAASFVGVLLGAVFWVPAIVSWVARLLNRSGASAQLAAANTLRNPRRTAATSTALLIGVTLVAMMSVGAATARTSLDGTLDQEYPFDFAIEGAGMTSDPGDGSQAPSVLSPTILGELSDISGVAVLAEVTTAPVSITWPDGTVSEDNELTIVDPAKAAESVNVDGLFAGLDDTTVAVDRFTASNYNLDSESTLELRGPDGTVTVGVTVTQVGTISIVASPVVGDQLDAAASVNGAWLKLTDSADASATASDIQDVVAETPVALVGQALERAEMEDLINTFLAIIVGLLGIAVIIALIGVANTLSLSVLERRRESATLRAIGLSRRQLRATLAIEGTLIAGVGAVLGVVLGLIYGWVGSMIVLSTFADVSLTVPWRDVTLVVAIAVVAGLLASVLPARSAARTSPVEALAVE